MNAEQTVTVLVVDDNPATLYSTSRVLRSAGWTVLEAATGAAALALAASHELSVVVLDVNLPDINGFEVCRRLRARPGTARTPVIHLSASFTNDQHRVQGLEGGADGYLTHPVEPPVLLATIRTFLRARHAELDMRKSEAKFRAVFDNAINGIALLSEDLVYLDVNPAMCELLGETYERIVTQPLTAYIPPTLDLEAARIIRLLAAEGSWRGPLPLRRADGRMVYLEWNISAHSVPGVRLAIVSDISQRLQSEREREALLMRERTARAEAERANHLKDDFLAMVSHELRTPLNAIVGWSELLKRDNLAKSDIAKGIAIIDRNAKAQADLINDLLDISRITSGKLHIDVQPVEALAMVESALTAVMPAAAAKQIHIEKRLAPDAGVILGDLSRLQQVLWNIMTNAVKFTDNGGTIEVTLRRSNGNVEIAIKDDGQGIKAELLPHIFERFRQGDSSTTRGHRGLGLGLAIAKHLVGMHGGNILAESAGEGRGAVFTVALPAANDQDAQRLVRPLSAPHHDVEIPTSLHGVHVLVVDDDADARQVVQRLLTARGAQTREAASAAEALAEIERFCPDVLITDIGMPDQDGYALLSEVRSRGYSAERLPAIALTAFAYSGDRARALLEGFQAHMAKPISAADVIKSVATLAGQRTSSATG